MCGRCHRFVSFVCYVCHVCPTLVVIWVERQFIILSCSRCLVSQNNLFAIQSFISFTSIRFLFRIRFLRSFSFNFLSLWLIKSQFIARSTAFGTFSLANNFASIYFCIYFGSVSIIFFCTRAKLDWCHSHFAYPKTIIHFLVLNFSSTSSFAFRRSTNRSGEKQYQQQQQSLPAVHVPKFERVHLKLYLNTRKQKMGMKIHRKWSEHFES